LYSWGLGDYGALGTGEFKFKSTPTRVDLPREVTMKLRQISCGAMHTAFLTEDGDVYACGSN
jgi:E3 ubiquitin-protein ligase HERC4